MLRPDHQLRHSSRGKSQTSEEITLWAKFGQSARHCANARLQLHFLRHGVRRRVRRLVCRCHRHRRNRQPDGHPCRNRRDRARTGCRHGAACCSAGPSGLGRHRYRFESRDARQIAGARYRRCNRGCARRHGRGPAQWALRCCADRLQHHLQPARQRSAAGLLLCSGSSARPRGRLRGRGVRSRRRYARG